MAEHERLRHADAFRRAEVSAVERGIHLASRVPTGYRRDPKTGRLVPNEMAPVVAEVFRPRAKGWGWTRLARWVRGARREPKNEQFRDNVDGP